MSANVINLADVRATRARAAERSQHFVAPRRANRPTLDEIMSSDFFNGGGGRAA